MNAAAEVHFMDHLAVVALIMDIPFLFFDETCFQLAQKYYPKLKVLLESDFAHSIERITSEYDVSFLTEILGKKGLAHFNGYAERNQKVWRNVFCPHGFSDKGFYFEQCLDEDIVLVYGQNMIDLLEEKGVWKNIQNYVLTGNYRYSFYRQHQDFYDSIFEQEIQSKFAKKQPIILYAPTWLDQENSSSFFVAAKTILDQLPSEYNMIVKLHPRLELDDIAGCYQLIGQYEKKPNVLFLTDFPLVFPILAHTDIYIGDISSVGYDFLVFDKPLFFLTSPNQKSRHLFQCGPCISSEEYPNIFKIIEQQLPQDHKKYSERRKEIWHYTFGNERSFSTIRSEIAKCIDDGH